MATYIEYQFDDHTTIWVEADDVDEKEGTTKVGVTDAVGNTVHQVNQSFEAAFSQVRTTAQIIRRQLAEAQADEVQISFGLKTADEAGNFVIGEVGLEASYTVTLKWFKPSVPESSTSS